MQVPSHSPSQYRRLVLIVLVAVGLLVACGEDGDTGPRPGSEAVYEGIESMTDCGDLQAEFNTAMDNVERYPAGHPSREAPLAYADAADERMREIGCYD